MPAIIVPQRWARQPQHPVRIAPEFAKDCVYAAIGSVPVDLVGGKTFTLSRKYTRHGAAWQTSGITTQHLASSMDGFFPSGTQATVLMQAYEPTASSHQAIGPDRIDILVPSNGANANVYLPYAPDGKVYWRWGAGETEGTTSLSVASLSFEDGDWFAFTVGPRGMEAWQNGKLVGSNSGTPSRTAGNARAAVIGGHDNGSSQLAIKFTMLATVSRQLPVDFLRRRDYWGLFTSLPASIYSFPVQSFNPAWNIAANSLIQPGALQA